MTDLQAIRLIQAKAEQWEMDENLLLAFAKVESSFQSAATRYEPNWRYYLDVERFAEMSGVSKETERVQQATSFGLMQIMGSVCRELGYTGKLAELIARPDMCLDVCLKKLKRIMERFDNEDFVIAAWNAGTPKKDANGKFINKVYVDKVQDALRRLRAIDAIDASAIKKAVNQKGA